MNFKQAPLNRATIISHFSAGTSEAQEGRACPNAKIREKERKREREKERKAERVTVTDRAENRSCDYMMSNVF